MPNAQENKPNAAARVPLRILIVEDEAELLRPMEACLRGAGYSVRVARDGRSALGLLQADADHGHPLPDLLITDLAMPGMGGIGLLSGMQAKGLKVDGILAMSGQGNREDLVALMRHGVADFIDKPFSLRALMDRIADIEIKLVLARRAEAEKFKPLREENLALRQRMRQFESREAMGRLTQGILHDVNNCLAIITGSAEMIKLSLASGDRPVDGYADSITDLTMKAVGTLRQLDALNRMGEGIWTCFDLHGLIEGTLGLTRTALGGCFRIRADYLPEPALVQGDAVTLQSIFINLLVALRDSLGKAGGNLRLSTHIRLEEPEAGSSEGWVMLRLAVSGAENPGPVSLREWDADQAREAIRGLGGDMTVDSGLEWGAVVTFELPAVALPLSMGLGLEWAGH